MNSSNAIVGVILLMIVSTVSAADQWVTLTVNGRTGNVILQSQDENGLVVRSSSRVFRIYPNELSTADRVRFGFASEKEQAAYIAAQKAQQAAEEREAAALAAQEARELALLQRQQAEADLAIKAQLAEELKQLRIQMQLEAARRRGEAIAIYR